MSDELRVMRILAALRDGGPASVDELAASLTVARADVRSALAEATMNGYKDLILCDGERFRLAEGAQA